MSGTAAAVSPNAQNYRLDIRDKHRQRRLCSTRVQKRGPSEIGLTPGPVWVSRFNSPRISDSGKSDRDCFFRGISRSPFYLDLPAGISSRLLKNSWLSFRGAPKARTRNPEPRDFLLFWIPGPPLRGVPESSPFVLHLIAAEMFVPSFSLHRTLPANRFTAKSAN